MRGEKRECTFRFGEKCDSEAGSLASPPRPSMEPAFFACGAAARIPYTDGLIDSESRLCVARLDTPRFPPPAPHIAVTLACPVLDLASSCYPAEGPRNCSNDAVTNQGCSPMAVRDAPPSRRRRAFIARQQRRTSADMNEPTTDHLRLPERRRRHMRSGLLRA